MNRGSKSRASFGNLYAVYALIREYVNKGFVESGQYEYFEGSRFSDLLNSIRSLPYGSKMQNHALNHRLNQEFLKYFPLQTPPVVRLNQRYWFNENLLLIEQKDEKINIAPLALLVVEAYVEARTASLNRFVEDCKTLSQNTGSQHDEAITFLSRFLAPESDARFFEIIAYAILKNKYAGQTIYWGWNPEVLKEEQLQLYKTGRTNANDGGIDYVMKPLGRFFQATETIDFKKYFLDIEKVNKYPITFVIKSEITVEELLEKIEKDARGLFPVDVVVQSYMACIEEIINLPMLLEWLEELIAAGKQVEVLTDILKQSKYELET